MCARMALSFKAIIELLQTQTLMTTGPLVETLILLRERGAMRIPTLPITIGTTTLIMIHTGIVLEVIGMMIEKITTPLRLPLKPHLNPHIDLG